MVQMQFFIYSRGMASLVFWYPVTVWCIWQCLQGVSCEPIRCHRPKDNGLVIDGKCAQCPICPDGQGLDELCGGGDGAGAQCRPCFKKIEFSHDSLCYECTPCGPKLHRETKYLCRPNENAHCGKCLKNFYQDSAMVSTVPCFPCSPHSSNKKCQKDRIPTNTEDIHKSTFHTSVNPAMDDIDNTTQQQDMCTATNRIDATYTGVKEKCTSTLQPEKDNGFALLERLLQIRKRDSAVIPLEEKNPDPKRPIKAKLEISHTPLTLLVYVFLAVMISFGATVALYGYSQSESNGNNRRRPEDSTQRSQPVSSVEECTQSALPVSGHGVEECTQSALPVSGHGVEECTQSALPVSGHGVEECTQSALLVSGHGVEGCVIHYYGNPLYENLLRSKDKTKHASSAIRQQETDDQNEETDSEVSAIKETGDSNDATAIAEPEPLKAHRLLGGQ